MNSNRAACLLFCFLICGVYAIGVQGVQSALAQNGVITLRNAQSNIKTFDVASQYGTLAFRGQVERMDMGDRYKYKVRMAVVFAPGETLNGYTRTNRTEVADLRACRLVATSVPGDNQPVQVLYEEVHPIAIRLGEFGQQAVLPDLEFYLAKSIADRATNIGLGVTDGKLLWPIPTQLK